MKLTIYAHQELQFCVFSTDDAFRMFENVSNQKTTF